MAKRSSAQARIYVQAPDMPGEEWRVNARFPNYEVSSLGRVRRLTTVTCAKAGTLLKAVLHHGGYWHHGLTVNGVVKTVLLNRLVCETFHGLAPSKEHVAAHGDHDRANNRADNLRWATILENEADKTAADRRPIGSRNAIAKLTEADVADIRAWKGIARDIGARYGVHTSTIYKIWNRESWKHVP